MSILILGIMSDLHQQLSYAMTFRTNYKNSDKNNVKE